LKIVGGSSHSFKWHREIQNVEKKVLAIHEFAFIQLSLKIGKVIRKDVISLFWKKKENNPDLQQIITSEKPHQQK
jgi:hypothetical protein